MENNNKSIMKVKEFTDYTTSQESEVNSFIEKIGIENVLSVTPLFNTILGGIQYVVVYSTPKTK